MECGTSSCGVSQTLVYPGNSQSFPADAPCDRFSIGHAAWSQRSRWVTPNADVIYGNTPCGRGSIKFPRASVVAKSGSPDRRSISVEYTYVLRVLAQDDRYFGTSPPRNVGPFATPSQPMNQGVWSTAVWTLVHGTALYLAQSVICPYEIMDDHKPNCFNFLI